MRRIGRLIKRAIILWCIYGVYLICKVLNPLVSRVGDPLSKFVTGFPCDSARERCVVAWVGISVIAVVVIFAYALLDIFTEWLFKEHAGNSEFSDDEEDRDACEEVSP